MSPEERARWQAAAALMREWQACEPAEREAWLQAQSPAPEVGAILQRLLDAERTPDPRLDALPGLGSASLLGRRIGDWELLEEIGSGGMARVFRARRLGSDYEQQAALKLLLQALRDPDRQRRFQRERQILARLRHPGIAGLIDGGVGEGGTAFLVLQLVEGERIDDWCEARGLDARARVRLLLEVCDALAHAHRQLVVHRDLKPANVMVDRNGRALLLDFGIARLTDETQGEADTVTRAFTPGYAAPEQIRGDAPVGTAVDVYGLGALTHRLLAGAPPLADAEGDVRLPSTRPDLPPAAAQTLRGDLDAILMRALAHDPARRYAGVDAFAADLRAWLEQRPVQAHAPRFGYRVGKWLRRHRQLAIAGALLLLALLAGVGATLWQARAAREQAHRAERVLDFLDGALEELVGSTPNASAREDRRAMLDRLAAQGRAEFADDPLARADVLHRLALQYDRIGQMRQAHALTVEILGALESALPADHPLLAMRRADEALLAHRVAGEDATGRERIEAALDRALRAVDGSDAHSALAWVLLSRSSVFSDWGRREEANRLIERAVEHAAKGDDESMRDTVEQGYAAALQRLSRWEELRALQADRLRRARARHGEEHETVGFALLSLASATSNLGRRREAADQMQQATDLLDRIFPEGSQVLQNLLPLAVNVFDRAGRHDAASAVAQRNLDMARRMYGDRNRQTGTALATLGRMQLARGDLGGAEASAREALSIYLEGMGPDSDFAAIARHYLANALSAADRHAEALAEREQARAVIASALGEETPWHARVLSGLGTDLFHLERIDEALVAHRRAVGLLEAQQDRSGQLELARLGLAETLVRAGRHAEAAAQLAQITLAERADPETPASQRWYRSLVEAELACAQASDCAGRVQALEEATRALDRAPPPVRRRRVEALRAGV